MVSDKSKSEILKGLKEIQTSLENELISLQKEYKEDPIDCQVKNFDAFTKKALKLKEDLKKCYEAMIDVWYDNHDLAEQALIALEIDYSGILSS